MRVLAVGGAGEVLGAVGGGLAEGAGALRGAARAGGEAEEAQEEANGEEAEGLFGEGGHGETRIAGKLGGANRGEIAGRPRG